MLRGEPNIVSLHGPTAASVTELLQLPARDFGTVYHHISEMRGLIVQSVLAFTKNIFVWIMRPQRSVNHFNCAIYRNSLTYLHRVGRHGRGRRIGVGAQSPLGGHNIFVRKIRMKN